MSEVKKFPVLHGHREKIEGMPDFVDWSKLSNDQAIANHSQTLKRLSERGGMCPREIYANIKDVCWSRVLKVSDDHIKYKILQIKA